MAGARVIREEIDRYVQDGASLEEIEREVIDAAPGSEDVRAALWLYAWGCVERERSRSPVLVA